MKNQQEHGFLTDGIVGFPLHVVRFSKLLNMFATDVRPCRHRTKSVIKGLLIVNHIVIVSFFFLFSRAPIACLLQPHLGRGSLGHGEPGALCQCYDSGVRRSGELWDRSLTILGSGCVLLIPFWRKRTFINPSSFGVNKRVLNEFGGC